MTTLVYTHPVFLEHNTGSGHPESPARLEALLEALKAPEFATLQHRTAPRASLEQLTRVHIQDYVAKVLGEIPAQGYRELDGDTVVCPASGEAALRAAGAVCAAIDATVEGEADNAFCAVRPPGHHAEPARSMGFCLFNNVAVGAAHACATHHGLRRAAIIDFDVHHGNGTQLMFASDPYFLYASTHQSPLFPGTGARSERGVGNIVNLPLAPGSGSADFHHAVSEYILPKLYEFMPDIILISAGFDAHYRDPLSELELTEEDYAWVTRELLDVAKYQCDGRIVSTLEGGYDLRGLSDSTVRHVRELLMP